MNTTNPLMCVCVVLCRQDKVVAVASMNMDPVVAQAAQMMLHSQVITKAEIKYALFSVNGSH